MINIKTSRSLVKKNVEVTVVPSTDTVYVTLAFVVTISEKASKSSEPDELNRIHFNHNLEWQDYIPSIIMSACRK